MVKFGASAINRREYALGLEAIQNGVAYDMQNGGTWTADRQNCQFVAEQYERAAQGIGWKSKQTGDWNNKQTKIALIVPSIGDDDAGGKFLRSLARFIDPKRFKLQIYTTESQARREKPLFGQASHVAASAKRGVATLEDLAKQKISVWTAPTDGDIVASAKALATQMIKDKIDIAIIDASQADPIAAMIACWETAPIKINLCRKTPLYLSSVAAVTYLDPIRFEADRDHWQKRGVEARYILEGVDTSAELGDAPIRSQYGIPDNAIVLATASDDLDRSMSEEFVDSVVAILRAHPQSIYLLIGDAEMTWQNRKFESAGIAKRVGYAGKRRDLPGFLRIADVYLSEFPLGGASGALMAMGVEAPVVAMKCGNDAEHRRRRRWSMPRAVGSKDPAAYIERVGKIVRDANYRAKLGKMLRNRVEQHFGFAQTARHFEQLCDQLTQARMPEQATIRPAAPDAGVVAKVACTLQ